MKASLGVAIALVPALVSLQAGCVSTQPAGTDSAQSVGIRAGPTDAPSSSSLRGEVRVDSIQRLDSEDGKAVLGVVTLRNMSARSRTVKVSVSWTDRTGRPLSANSVSTKSVTLASGESTEARFDGPPGSRDFKVALGAATN
jgi:hypothetical protein